MVIVKIYLGLSLVLWTVWGQFIFRQFLDPAYTSQGLQAPSYVVGANYRVLIYCTCHFQGGSLCLFQLLQCLISALTQRGSGGNFFRLTCSVMLWGGKNTADRYHWRVLSVSWPHWVCPCSWCVCFPCLHCLASRLLCQELSEAGPGLYALPRSKPLRFRLSGSPQRHRFSWACVLCPSQVSGVW